MNSNAGNQRRRACWRAFTAIMFLFTMAENADDEKLPLITIPAQ